MPRGCEKAASLPPVQLPIPMITVCPSCSLTLAVTAAELRAGQGFVRCSGCQGMFNALPTLREPHEPEPVAAAATVSPAVLAPFDPVATDPVLPLFDPAATDVGDEDLALEFDPRRADVASVFVEPKGQIIVVEEAARPGDEALQAEGGAPDGGPPAPPDVGAAPVARHGEPEVAADIEAFGAVEVIEVVTPAPPVPDDAQPEPVAGSASVGVAPTAMESESQGAEAPATEASRTEQEPAAETAAVEADGAAGPADAGPAPPPEGDLSAFGVGEREPPPAWHQRGLAAAAVGLGLLLVLQVLNHYRHDLATRPALYGPLKSVYDAIGLPLVPRWNVAAYDVRQLGAFASSGGDGQLAVRMSVLNGAKVAQPAPLLRVNVQDRYGNTIATRDVPPAAYLPAALRPSGFLQAGQRLDTEVRFLDPGRAAVGFEIDACVPSAEASLVCASEAR